MEDRVERENRTQNAGWARPFLRPFLIFSLFFLLFFAARVALLVFYGEDFQDLSSRQIARAFLRGARFDVSIILAVAGGPLFLMMLPFGWARRRSWQKIWGWCCFAVFLVFIFTLAADLVYFDFVHRHIGPEVGIATEDLDEKIEVVVRHYLPALFAWVAGMVGLFFAWRRIMRAGETPMGQVRLWPRAVATAILGGVMFLGIWGQFGDERLQIFHAYEGASPVEACLTLNGPFTAIHSLVKSGVMEVNFYPWEEAMATVRHLYHAPQEKMADPQYPMYRSREGTSTEGRPNVVLIMLEGWSAESVGAVRKAKGMAPYEQNLTPNFDKYCEEGVLFFNFYASGRRSLNGICSALTGFPCLPDLPYLGKGLEQMHFAYLGDMAQTEGYATYLLQSTKRKSHYVYRIAEIAGFQHFFGAEDIPSTVEEEKKLIATFSAYDHDLMQEAHRQFTAAPKPFLGYVLTSNSHSPYKYLEPGQINYRHVKPEWTIYPRDDQEHEYWNSLLYADWLLGEFFGDAKEAGYYDNTVFIVVSDHIQRALAKSAPPSRFHIPCLVICPGMKLSPEEKQRIGGRVGGQADIIQTIAHLAGWTVPQAAFGRSLFDESMPGEHGAMCQSSEMFIRVEQDGWVFHDLHRRINAGAFVEGADLDAIERRMLSVAQVATLLLLKNRLCPPK